MPFCDVCGKPVSADALFCRECGRRLQAPTPSPRLATLSGPRMTTSKDRRYKAVIVVMFIVALALGSALGSTLNPQVKTVTSTAVVTKTNELATTWTQIVTTTVSMAGTEVTTTQLTGDRAIKLSLSLYEKRVSTGAYLSYSVSTNWEGLSLVTNLRITIANPDGKVVFDEKMTTSTTGIDNEDWVVPAGSKLGIYTLTVVASKEGYISAQASDSFEVY